MKKTIVTLCGILLMSIASFAQTADEIMDKAIQARGGVEKLNNLKSVKMEGNVAVAGMDIPVKTVIMNKRGYRMELDIMGQSIVMAVDGDKAWTINPMQGGGSAEDLPEDQAKGLISQIDLADFANYKANGMTAELVGKEKLDGKEVYVVKVTGKTGIETIHSIDVATNYILKTAVKSSANSSVTEVKLSDYKLYDGVAFPTTTETTHPQAGQMITTITKVEINPTVDEAIFVKPKN